MAVEGLLATTTDLHPRRVFRRGSTSEAAWWDVLREDALLRTRCAAAAYLYWIARGVAAFVGNRTQVGKGAPTIKVSATVPTRCPSTAGRRSR